MTAPRRPSRAPAVTRRTFLKAGGAAAAALAAGCAGRAARAADPDRPNLLVILTDQQHIDALSAAGCPHLRTPAMDHLVRTGVNFRLSYTTNPVCSPARSSLLTGRMPSETGVHENGLPIRPEVPNLGQWLAEKAGYDAVYAGKWHLPGTYARTMPGFRVLEAGISGHGNVCDSSVSLACEALLRRRPAGRPLLLVASFMQPHDICEWLRLNIEVPGGPRYPEVAGDLPPLPANFAFDPDEPTVVKKIRGACEPAQGRWTPEHWRYYLWSYYRHVEMVDGEIGRLLDALRATGQDQNTLVLLTSDHGEGCAHHQTVRKSLPYDEATRVPMVVSWLGRAAAGRTDARHLASGLDVTPTLCEAAGVEPPPDQRGRSLGPLLRDRPDADDRRFLVLETNEDRGRVVRSRGYKYVTYRGDPLEQLFDMSTDPGETVNLARRPEHADALREHRAMLRAWEARLAVAPNVPASDAWWRRPDTKT